MTGRSSIAAAYLAAVLAIASSVAAKEQRPAWSASAGIVGSYNSNIQQSPSAEEQDDFITELTTGVQLNNDSIRVLPAESLLNVRGYVYADHSDLDYMELRPEIRYRIGRLEPYVQYLFSPRRFLFDDDDGTNGGGNGNAYYADHVGAVGLRGRFGDHKQLRARLAFEIEYQNFREDFTSHNALIPGMRTSLRYTFGPMLTPTFDFQYGVRDAHRQNFDREEFELAPGFESQLADWLLLRFRYKHEWRSYTVEKESTASGRTNRNFGRDDDIDETETWLIAPLPFLRDLAVGVGYRYRHGDSNRNDRRYDVHEGGIELTYNFAGDWPWD